MSITMVKWHDEISRAAQDEQVGIRIATLLESNGRGTYITILPPGASVKPHYHQEGDEEYHIISGSGLIKLAPANNSSNPIQFDCQPAAAQSSFIIPPNMIHQLINQGSENLTLIFSCPLAHLNEDRVVIATND